MYNLPIGFRKFLWSDAGRAPRKRLPIRGTQVLRSVCRSVRQLLTMP